MKFTALNKTLINLTHIPAGGAPVISAFFNLSEPRNSLLHRFEQWVLAQLESVDPRSRDAFHSAVDRVKSELAKVTQLSGSVAVFARAGETPFFLPLTFRVALKTKFILGETPSIYPLVELKDRFDRFLVVSHFENDSRIAELDLGETADASYSNLHTQRYTSLETFIERIDSFISRSGHHSIVLVGAPEQLSELRAKLPKHLARRVVDTIASRNPHVTVPELIANTVSAQLAREARESSAAVAELFDAVYLGKPVAVSVAQTAEALRDGTARLLIVSNTLNDTDRESLVRLATTHGVEIETVSNNSRLDRSGGAGAILKRSIS